MLPDLAQDLASSTPRPPKLSPAAREHLILVEAAAEPLIDTIDAALLDLAPGDRPGFIHAIADRLWTRLILRQHGHVGRG